MKVFHDSLRISIVFIIALQYCTATVPQYCPFQNRAFLQPQQQNAGDICVLKNQKCNPNNIYYTIDGSCNNLLFPDWGQSRTPYTRIIAGNYSDGICAFRKSSDKSPLPLPRVVRTTVLENKDIPSNNLNILFYAFGQWLDHDTTQQLPTTSPVLCCRNGQPDPFMNADICLPQLMLPNDEFYSKFRVTCIDMKRSINTRMLGCGLRPCAQINYETGYLDLSILYGPDQETATNLRTYNKGQLKTSVFNKEQFPPVTSGSDCMGDAACFLGGDMRINTDPELSSMSIIFLRVHNYIATKLHQLNPHWLDEKLYQEARRILIAMYQHVLYAEHVPLLVGPYVSWLSGLYPQSVGYNNKYNQWLNGQTITCYEAAAGRALHSLITGKVSYQGSKGQSTSYRLEDKYFNQGFLLEPNVSSNIIKAYFTQSSSNQDQYFTEALNNKLYIHFLPGAEYGFDLSSIDISRGRDHGVPPYNQVRQACGLCRISKFEDLANEIKNPMDVWKLKSLYKSVDDIDYYVGALLEQPLPKAAVGPTLACILSEAFRRWKYGDRLYYEFPSAQFRSDQLASIRQTIFSQFVCIANSNQQYVYKSGFQIPSSQNPIVPCSQITKINLALWKENISSL